MKIKSISLILTLFFTFNLFAQETNIIPNGWFIAGSKPSEFNIGIDKSITKSGSQSLLIQSKNSSDRDFRILMQTISSENYIKRLRLSAYIKSENIDGQSSIWMRIDGEDKT